jgi:EAL domain-containing protein (putative c-di-GMP-specific phosphodiesterase class I)
MEQHRSAVTEKPAIFGRRKMVPRAFIADAKRHIRTFLADALDELGFLTFECANVAELGAALTTQDPDLVVLGLSPGGIEAGRILETLASSHFAGKVLPVGPRESILARATGQLGRELGIDVLPTLPTPFGAEGLRDSVAMLLPMEGPPSPAVDVTEALAAGWLELWYQQKIDARTLMPRGIEALVRMRHPAWGVVPPASFISDDNDPTFRSLSDFVVGRALDDWRTFVEQSGPIDISINLPASLLEDRDAVCDLCTRMPVHPAFGGLLIELKCADVIARLDAMIDVARRIRFHNIAIAIDDLGAEWPALMGLPSFPFAEVKVDRQFVTGCAGDRLKQAVCRGVVELADRYGVRTVAKGVETRADFITAREMGFDLVQGFLFGKPMAMKKFSRATLSRPVLVPQ